MSRINDQGWISAVTEAMNHWGHITNCQIEFIGTGADTAIYSDDSPQSPMQGLSDYTIAQSTPPQNGYPGPAIAVNLDIQTRSKPTLYLSLKSVQHGPRNWSLHWVPSHQLGLSQSSREAFGAYSWDSIWGQLPGYRSELCDEWWNSK